MVQLYLRMQTIYNKQIQPLGQQKYTLSTAPTAIAADEITASGFNANWEALFGVENYRLDVATDESFTSMVSGYNNLNVGNVLTYEITGLDENTTYYYRVRGAKTDGTSPSSSTITVNTESSGPVELYVAPNLDPVAETDPTPATIAVPTVFVIEDYESKNLDDALLVNNSSFTTSSVKSIATGASTKSAYVRVTNWDGYLRLNVQLPAGKVLSDYTTLSYDEYLDNGYDHNHKDIRVFIDNVQQFSVASGQVTYAAWTTRTFSLAGKTAGNTFVLDIGMRTGNGSYFIDNVKLSPAPAPTATTATAATHINSTSFKAQWSLFEGSTAYFLDVATNNTFTNMVSGFDNLNVGNVANYVVSGLSASTTYYYRVRGTNTSTNSNPITVTTKAATAATNHFATRGSGNISEITTWQSSVNNTGWMSATAAPTADAKSIRVLNGHELTVDVNTEVAEIIVRAGGKLTVPATKSLELTGKLYLESSEADGTATFVNDGTTTITGDAVVKQHLTAGRNWNFSSPVSNATSAVFKATTGNSLWERNVAGNSWTEITATDVALTPLKGFVGKLAANGVVTFTGPLNNGTVTPLTLTSSAVTGGKFHLVGNPYPSYLDWQAVAVANPNLTGSMWFRTKTAVSEQVPTSVYTFSTVLYTTEAGLQIVNGNANTTVTPKIPPMQAFWVRTKDAVTSTSFTVNNTMRHHVDVSGNKFKAPAVKNQTLRLEVSNGINKDEALIYFNNSASDEFDRFDSPKMLNNIATVPEIFTIVGNERLVINGLNSYNYSTLIPLGFIAGQTQNYSIRASQVQNIDVDTKIVLFDNDTQTEFDLTGGKTYSFTSDAINSNNRFDIRFKSATGTTSIDNVDKTAMFVSSLQGRLTVQMNTLLSENAKVTVYNTMGQSIYSQSLSNAITQLSRNFDSGVYLVRVENGDKSFAVKSLID